MKSTETKNDPDKWMVAPSQWFLAPFVVIAIVALFTGVLLPLLLRLFNGD